MKLLKLTIISLLLACGVKDGEVHEWNFKGNGELVHEVVKAINSRPNNLSIDSAYFRGYMQGCRETNEEWLRNTNPFTIPTH